jgi:hypothetical protein
VYTVTLLYRQSLIPGAGLGLFARVDLKARTIISYYNGIHLPKNEVSSLSFYLFTKRSVYIYIYRRAVGQKMKRKQT